ncbi:F-box-like/WD repeat-containing protein TBL1XR1 isoform X3 [Daphnia pulicaria]|uniref:F-box-like/WD repeat-containing protein TBL1XR1 isoform X3 n=1 Tax=Daphnia pulicaria TaxID=35523 RepID=UPI001EE9B2D5|nr:F-box-like/WD repeat-containing protein TBL1XR1 isoform X3 [Daphnia pulicaria]
MPLFPAPLQFMETDRAVVITTKKQQRWISRFHPTKPILACGSCQVVLFKTTNASSPFLHWREKQMKFGPSLNKRITALEWNLSGTQLAIGCEDGDVIVWNYPNVDIVFQINRHLNGVHDIKWNPFEHDVLATIQSGQTRLLIWHSYIRLHSKSNLYCTIEESNKDCNRQIKWVSSVEYKRITLVEWIAKNVVALGFSNGLIEITEIDECESARSRVIQKFKHNDGITSLIWNERIQYLASSSYDKTIKVWSINTNKPIHNQSFDSYCYTLAWRPNGKIGDGIEDTRKMQDNFNFACGLKDGSIVMWNPLDNFAEKKKLKIDGHVTALSFSAHGQFLASAEHNQCINIWSTEVLFDLDAGFHRQIQFKRSPSRVFLVVTELHNRY